MASTTIIFTGINNWNKYADDRCLHPYQELLTLPENTSSTQVFSKVHVAQSLVFFVVLCRALFCPFVLFLLDIVPAPIWLLLKFLYPVKVDKSTSFPHWLGIFIDHRNELWYPKSSSLLRSVFFVSRFTRVLGNA